MRVFFNTEIPESLNGFVCLKFLEKPGIKDILPEREPQLYIERAVLGNIDNRKAVAALTLVTPDMCTGHFDWFPIAPLAILAQCAGQAGAILVNLVSKNKPQIPLGVHVKDTKIISDKNNVHNRKVFAVPGDNVLFIAFYKGGKFNFHKVTVEIYVKGSNIGKLEEIEYVLGRETIPY